MRCAAGCRRRTPDILRELSDGERRWYLSAFGPLGAPFLPSEDVWFEYVDERDAEAASAFVADVLPAGLSVLTRVAAEEDARRSVAGSGVTKLSGLPSGLDPAPPWPVASGPHEDPELERLLDVDVMGSGADVSSTRVGPGGGLKGVLARLGLPHRLVTVADGSSIGLVAAVYSVPGAPATDLLQGFLDVVPKPPAGAGRGMQGRSAGSSAMMADRPGPDGVAALGAVDGYVIWLVGDAPRVRHALAPLVQRLLARTQARQRPGT